MNEVMLGWIGAALVALCFGVAQLMYARDAALVKRHQGRFRMFAARDRLVRLAAEHKVSEDSVAWALTYTSVNVWLNLNHKHSVWADLRSRLQHEHAIAKNPDRNARLQGVVEQLTKTCEEVPEFGQTVVEIENARRDLVRGRMRWYDRAVLRVIATALWPFIARASKEPSATAIKDKTIALRPEQVYGRAKIVSSSAAPDMKSAVNDLVSWRGEIYDSGEHRALAN